MGRLTHAAGTVTAAMPTTAMRTMGALLATAIFGFALALPAAAQGTTAQTTTPQDATSQESTLQGAPSQGTSPQATLVERPDEAATLAGQVLEDVDPPTSEVVSHPGRGVASADLTAWTDPNTGDLQWRFPGIVIPIPIFCKGPVEPLPQPPPPPANPGPAGTANYQVCPQAAGRVPPAIQQYALVNPHAIQGYGEYRNPNVPPSPWNQLRTWLHLRDPGKPFSICNSVVWKAGCY